MKGNALMGAQTMGWICVNGELFSILVRQKKYGRALKIRSRITDNLDAGTHFEDEEIMLKENPDMFVNLKAGKVITL